MKTKLIHIIKTKLMHVIYIAVILVIVFVQSVENVIEDEIRIEIACKEFILHLLEDIE